LLITVFTPSHDPTYLQDCYRSLLRQTWTDWEWIVLLNGKADWQPADKDPRVVVRRAASKVRGVGALKHAACELGRGDVLLELDHDDVLTDDCLSAVAEAFRSDPQCVGVFSDFAQINEDGSPNDERFDTGNGWVYTQESIEGARYLRCHAMLPSPHNMAYIWFEPNHVRAFRRSAYEKVGGYNPKLSVLDDQELMVRLYLEGEFHHVDRLLYLQRVHPANTQADPRTNAFIQEQTVAYYQEHIEAMALAWARRHGLAALCLTTPTSVEVSTDGYDEIEIDPAEPKLPAPSDSVGVIKATDILQRVPDRARFLNEAYRVLAHAGLLLTETPSTDGRGAFQDPSHIAFYNENSFSYLTQAALRRTIPALTARLQLSHLRTYYPSELMAEMQIPYVQANLLAVKEGPRQGGPMLC
jgi:hypothetical protein